jgi:hypothetical protein
LGDIVPDSKFTTDDLLSEEPRKRFDTLGKILKAMKEPMGFKPSFQE